MEDIIGMSRKERDRMVIMEKIAEDRLSLVDASKLMSVCYRQGKRIWGKYKLLGARGLIHGNRGKPAKNAIPEKITSRVFDLYRERYHGYGPTFTSEKLYEEYGLGIHPETLRLLLKKEGLWKRKREHKKHRKYRERKHHFGEMLQLDGSFHKWFFDNDEEYCLLNVIDDATNKNFGLFDKEETIKIAMIVLWKWIKKYGIPQSIYLDQRNAYIAQREPTLEERLNNEEALTYFGRTCKKLGIRLIFAHSAEAKGRIERRNQVHQDRLIKELKLNGINDSETANKFLVKKYFPKLNKRFEVAPISTIDFHRPVPKDLDLRTVFCFEEERIINNDWTIRHNNIFYQIKKENDPLPMPKTKVIVSEWLNGTIHIMYKDKDVELKVKKLKAKPERENKPLIFKKYIPPLDHPWRNWWNYKKRRNIATARAIP